jgi:hypothetical protein
MVCISGVMVSISGVMVSASILIAKDCGFRPWSSQTKDYKIDCCLTCNTAIFQLYHGENKLIFNEMMVRSALY